MRIENNLPNTAAGGTPNTVVALSRPGFAKALDQVQQTQPASVKVIQSGDTLTGIVKEQAQKQGVKLSPSEEFRWAQTLAADSGIQNPNSIFPGQKIQLQNMLSQWQAGQTQPQNQTQNLAQTAPQGAQAKSNDKIETVLVTASRPTQYLARHSIGLLPAASFPRLKSKTFTTKFCKLPTSTILRQTILPA